jgi:hypothetical protein
VHTNQSTIRAIMAVILSFFAAEDPPEINDIWPDAPQLLNAAYVAQEIWWNKWFKGRVSKPWQNLYDYDLQTTSHSMNHQTPEKWASRIIEMTWQFVLDSWTINNNSEHGVYSNPLEVRKQKIIQKIIWQKDHIDHFPNNYLATITEEHLQGHPFDFIMMTDSQIQILICASCTKQAQLSNDDKY